MTDWTPWIDEANVMMDGDGAFRHLPYSGSYREQPAFDMQVLNIIRRKWNALRNDKLRNKRGR
jgi:hypothetical protein